MNNHYNAEEYYLYLKFEEERGRTAREIGSCKNIPCQKRSFCNSMPMIVGQHTMERKVRDEAMRNPYYPSSPMSSHALQLAYFPSNVCGEMNF